MADGAAPATAPAPTAGGGGKKSEPSGMELLAKFGSGAGGAMMVIGVALIVLSVGFASMLGVVRTYRTELGWLVLVGMGISFIGMLWSMSNSKPPGKS